LSFRNRQEAGRALAEELAGMGLEEPLVIGLPRGGVPVAREVVLGLGAELDIGLVRKIGAPDQPEFGLGALGEDGTIVLDEDSVRATGTAAEELAAVIDREKLELERRRVLYRAGRPPVPVYGRTVVLVDDGLATGVTATAAARVMRARGAARVIIAVPVCPPDTFERLADEVDQVVALLTPHHFGGVGEWYADFTQVTDEQVLALLDRSGAPTPPDPDPPYDQSVPLITSDGAELLADISVPPAPRGLVVFVHGSGSSRLSPRNRAVAESLAQRDLATVLFDLLTPAEAARRDPVFDIELLAGRLVDLILWVGRDQLLGSLPLGLFGASTGAAAALRAAAIVPGQIRTVVSRGGRPDLAGSALGEVDCPVLLLVGGDDHTVLDLNEGAAAVLGPRCELVVIPGAGHIFEEPGKLEMVASLAGDWLSGHLTATT
jgi:putative phosphoribosyl transferase